VVPDDTTILESSALTLNAPLGGGALKIGLVIGVLRGTLGASRRTWTSLPVFNECTSTVVWYASMKPGLGLKFPPPISWFALEIVSDLSADTGSYPPSMLGSGDDRGNAGPWTTTATRGNISAPWAVQGSSLAW
jgi:hypothetical protein